MDSHFEGSYDSIDGTVSPNSEELLNYVNSSNYKKPSVNLTSIESDALQPPDASFPSSSSSSDDNDSDAVLKYISQVLLEEDMNEKPSMFHDSLALQAAEKPFYDALGKKYPLSPDDIFSGSSNNSVINNLSTISTNTNATILVESRNLSSSSDLKGVSIQNPMANLSMPLGFNIFSDRESMIQFQKGVEEASRFLPKTINLAIDLDNITYPVEPKCENEGYLHHGSRMRRIHYRDDEDFEGGRSCKQLATSIEDTDDLTEMFDRVLLPPRKNEKSCCWSEVSNAEHKHVVQRFKTEDDKKNVVDLRTLLILGAQAVASDDQRTAAELLKQIRQHTSPLGDGSQRLAHFFANALEARLAGTGSQICTALSSKRNTAAQILKAYQLFLSFCPFKKISIMFSNYNALKMSRNRKKLHIIDFGILYGFQWPALIQYLADRPEGPPVLRITGIERPQPGFRPAERVEETGRRLAKYCERFKVPFEFNPIAQKWETIKLEDIKLEKDEFVVVNCLYRFKNLLDETIVADSPRDAILRLIRKIKPDLFVHGIVNGSFNAPFFMTRFREALFYFSTWFDMYEVNVPREDSERLMYESEFYGREIMNVVACEGIERVERPETYKQWQVRNTRSGFRQLPLDSEIMEKLRHKMKYNHKDYSLDVDGNWALMGWKGRVTFAISAWIPS